MFDITTDSPYFDDYIKELEELGIWSDDEDFWQDYDYDEDQSENLQERNGKCIPMLSAMTLSMATGIRKFAPIPAPKWKMSAG